MLQLRKKKTKLLLLLSLSAFFMNFTVLQLNAKNMESEFTKAKKSLASGLRASALKSRITSENMANAKSTGSKPGADPYTRKILKLRTKKDRETGATIVSVEKVMKDTETPYQIKYDPSHPAANKDGYVKYPNVNSIYESIDMLESQKDHSNMLKAYKQITILEHMTINNMK